MKDSTAIIIGVLISALIFMSYYNKDAKPELKPTEETEIIKRLDLILKNDSIDQFYRSKEIYFDKKLNELGKKALDEGVFDEF